MLCECTLRFVPTNIKLTQYSSVKQFHGHVVYTEFYVHIASIDGSLWKDMLKQTYIRHSPTAYLGNNQQWSIN